MKNFKTKTFLIVVLIGLVILLGIDLFIKRGKEKKEKKVTQRFRVYFIVNRPKIISGNKEITNINIGDNLKKGDLIITDKKSMIGIIEPNSNTRIVIGRETTLRIEKSPTLTLNLERGKTYDYIDGKIEFYEKTPTLTIGVRGTRFVVISDEEKSIVKLAKGKIQIKRNIILPPNIKEKIETLNQGEMALVSKKENKKIEKEIGITISTIPFITKKPLIKTDKDIKELKDYENINLEDGKLIIKDNVYTVFINDKKIGEGNIKISLKEGTYRLRIKNYKTVVKIKKGKTIILRPKFKKLKEEDLKPIEPPKKPILEK